MDDINIRLTTHEGSATNKLLPGDQEEGEMVSIDMQKSTAAVQKANTFGMSMQQKDLTDSFGACFYLNHRL